jgi:hypothetical protein
MLWGFAEEGRERRGIIILRIIVDITLSQKSF